MEEKEKSETENQPKVLTEEAERALQEAEDRRQQEKNPEQYAQPKEIGGPKGRDPIRFGDWEKDGIVSDF